MGLREASGQREGAVWVWGEGDKAGDGIQVKRAIDVGKLVTRFVAIFVHQFGRKFGRIDGEQDEIAAPGVHLVGGHEHLLNGGAVDEPFAF